MKIFLSLAVICFALGSGTAAPAKGRYMFLRCNPIGGNANCLTHRGPEMELSPDLPKKLPASASQYIGGELVEEDWPVTEKKKSVMKTGMFLPEEGSGGFEGSAVEPSFAADGSGGSWMDTKTELFKGARGNVKGLLGTRRAKFQPPAAELRMDDLLQL